MKRTAESRFIVPLLAGLFLATSVTASFEPLPVGARAAGMGEAYTALADDVYALYYNPAGILQLQRPEFGAYYSQLFVGLTDNSEITHSFFGYGQPLGKNGEWGSMGVSYQAMDLPGLYKEESFGLTYGREFRRLWNLGGTFKFLKKSIGSDEFTNNAIDPITGNPTGKADPLLASGRSADALGIDLGLQYRITQAYAFGFAARNINSPDVAIGGEKDTVPAVFAASLTRHLRRGALGLELLNYKTTEKNIRLELGGEHWFKNGFALRAGGGFGSRDYSTISFGASYRMQSLQIDYATIYPLQGVEGTIGTQQVSLTVRLGKPPMDPLEQQLIKEKEQRIRAETEARYAKAERDRLKKQLIELTSAKSASEKALEREKAEQALKEAEAEASRQSQASQTRQERRNKEEIFKQYTEALADYNEKVRRGMGMEEKKTVLEKIKTEFGSQGIDMSTINRELKSLKVAQSRAQKDFDLSMNFYRRLVAQGASLEERKSMLQRIIQKYTGSGIDINTATDEMKTLK